MKRELFSDRLIGVYFIFLLWQVVCNKPISKINVCLCLAVLQHYTYFETIYTYIQITDFNINTAIEE